jgi:hypothetical protein
MTPRLSWLALEAVVDHYVRVLNLHLKPQQRTDLVHFLKSL